MEKIDKEEEFKKDKHLFTEFDMSFPQISTPLVEKHTLVMVPDGLYLRWCRFKNSEVPTQYFDIKKIFQREKGTLTFIEEPSRVYLLCSMTLFPDKRPTDEYFVVGAICISKDETLDWIWCHPFLRGQGIVSSFLSWYSCNEGPVFPQPPISPEMERCLKSVRRRIEKEGLLGDYLKVIKKHYSKKYLIPLEIWDYIPDNDFNELLHHHTYLQAKKAVDGTDIDIGKLIQLSLLLKYLLNRYPEQREEILKQYGVKDVSEQEVNKYFAESQEALKKYIHTGGDYRTD